MSAVVVYDSSLGAFRVSYPFCEALLFLGEWFTSKDIAVRNIARDNVIVFDADKADCADCVSLRLFGEGENIVIKYENADGGYYMPDGNIKLMSGKSFESLIECFKELSVLEN